ncbi:MAG: hypothetical protein ACRC5M_06895 [Anaeroplasmataceae bacterium]
MQYNRIKINEYTTLSTEDFKKVHGRNPSTLSLGMESKERNYKEYARSEEAYFGQDNVFRNTLITYVGELRSLYNSSIDRKNKLVDRRAFSKQIIPLIGKIEKLICKSFNIGRCYFGIMDDLNAWCVPACFDKNLVTKKDGKHVINKKFKVSLEDIMETKDGYKYKEPDGKIYCLCFGLGFFSKNGRQDEYSDAECAAIILHELGHAMQQAVCSINENLASVYTHAVFTEVYNCLSPIVLIGSFGLSALSALFLNVQYSSMKKEDPEDLGDDIIKQVIASNKEEFSRDRYGDMMNNNRDTMIKKLPRKGSGKFGKFFCKAFVFLFGGVFKIIFDLLASITSVPQQLYVSTQSGVLKKNRRFEQFADVFAASYALGPELASALAKLNVSMGSKADYGVLNLINYVPVVNVILNTSHYMNHSLRQLAAGYPNATGRMAAIYKTLKAELEINKDLSPEDKASILDEIETMNKIYDEYVFDWSPKGFVYALWHKITFKSLKNTKSDVEANVFDALEEIKKEEKFKKKITDDDEEEIRTKVSNLDGNILMKSIFGVVKNFKLFAPNGHKALINQIEPTLRKM